MGGRVSKPPEDEKGYARAEDRMQTILQRRQTTMTILLTLVFCMLVYVFVQSLVTGFALVSTPTGIAVPHMVWFVGALVVLFVGLVVTRMGIVVATDTISSGMIYFIVVCALNIVTCIIALAFFIVELSNAVSTFAVQSFGYLCATIALMAISLILSISLIVVGALFRRDILDTKRYFPNYCIQLHETTPTWTVTRDTDDSSPPQEEEQKQQQQQPPQLKGSESAFQLKIPINTKIITNRRLLLK